MVIHYLVYESYNFEIIVNVLSERFEKFFRLSDILKRKKYSFLP